MIKTATDIKPGNVGRHTMRKIAQTTLLFFLTILLLSNKSNQNHRKYQKKNIFVNDSGYVSIKNGEKFLLDLNKNDTIDLSYKKLNENDTIGKFYKKNNSENYFLFLNDIVNTKKAPTQFLLEVDSVGNIIKSERYVNGFYLCCWNNKSDGFGKCKNYFYLKSCGTGSAFCATELYFFKEIIPQNNLNPIIKSVFNGMCETYNKKILGCILESKYEIMHNSIVFHYEYKRGVSENSKKFKKLEKFDVEYELKNNVWIANDTTKLKEIQY